MIDTNLNPMTGFWILRHNELSDVDKKTLIDLYQPLVGPIAIGQYLLLWNESKKKTIVSKRLSHSHLLSLLDCGVNDFYEARIKLEALGLLKVYKKSDVLGDYLVYELYKPMEAADFFNESLLSTLLFEKVGRNVFEELVDKYSSQTNVLIDAQDITKSFLDVFTISNDNLITSPMEVKDAQSKVMEQPDNIPSIKSNKMEPIDWSFLEQLVSQYGVSANELQAKEESLYNMHVFYGLDELEISNLVARSVNISDNTIDEKRLERIAQTKYESRSNIIQKPIVETTSKSTGNPVVDKANELIPSEYLAYEKRQKNGYVASGETRILRNLQNRHVLPDSVINILIHYSLQNSPTLVQGLVDRVANDWIQNKISNAEDAFKRINEFNGTKNPNRSNKTKMSVVEKGTDWDKLANENKNDDQEAKRLIEEANARLNSLHSGKVE
ncbi:replication initiation protein [Companilactobacillus sp. RD055328]|uniref:DnaD domain protein n=1 Tax=Companilactobacillus sp. RD055328 TaxID=2916634 RepID=UPI001FC89A86|nr:DnaD domain protein [Companilactobacillus sp. RD055328]GKQ42504.1 replication initiation protein [Companilactobacillus sp. RD055328]